MEFNIEREKSGLSYTLWYWGLSKIKPLFSSKKYPNFSPFFDRGGVPDLGGGGRRFFPSSFAAVHDFFLDFLQIKKRIQKNQYKEQEKMEEKIVYRPKNRRWFFYTSARKKSSPPPPKMGTPPLSREGPKLGFFFELKRALFGLNLWQSSIRRLKF